MTPRHGTCIENDVKFGPEGDPTYYAVCAHGTEWQLGTLDACPECVLARCSHPKWGVDVEQGALEL